MIWSTIKQQISVDNLSNLDSPKNFASSSYNLSPPVQNLAIIIPKRSYSTSSVSRTPKIELHSVSGDLGGAIATHKILFEAVASLGNIDNTEFINFDSLESACEQIKFKYIGVSGVYKLSNKNDPHRFYIGSSNNLAIRMDEYNKLTKGLRNPQSSAELEISETPAIEWGLDIIYLTTPQLSLVYEQYAIISLNPTMNRYLRVVPRVNPLWGNNLDNAIKVIGKILSLFPEGSEGYNRFLVFLKTYQIANNLKYEVEYVDSKYYCSLIFAYDKDSPNKDPIVYSSINRALKGLQISYGTLLDYINNKYIYKSNLILSFEPLVVDSFSEYHEKPVGDNLLRKHIIVFNQDNEAVFEFKSGREMSRFFKIDGKVARAAIAKGVRLDK